MTEKETKDIEYLNSIQVVWRDGKNIKSIEKEYIKNHKPKTKLNIALIFLIGSLISAALSGIVPIDAAMSFIRRTFTIKTDDGIELRSDYIKYPDERDREPFKRLNNNGLPPIIFGGDYYTHPMLVECKIITPNETAVAYYVYGVHNETFTLNISKNKEEAQKNKIGVAEIFEFDGVEYDIYEFSESTSGIMKEIKYIANFEYENVYYQIKSPVIDQDIFLQLLESISIGGIKGIGNK